MKVLWSEMHLGEASGRIICVSRGASDGRATLHLLDVHNPGSLAYLGCYSVVFDPMSHRAALSADGILLASAHWEKGLFVYGLPDGDVRWSLPLERIMKIAFIKTYISIDFCEQKTRVYSRIDGELISELDCEGWTFSNSHGVYGLAVCRGMKNEYRSWVPPATISHRRLELVSHDVLDVAFEIGGSRSFVAEASGPVRCIDLKDMVEVWTYYMQYEHVVRLVYVPGGNYVFSMMRHREGGLQFLALDAATGKRMWCIPTSRASAGILLSSPPTAILRDGSVFRACQTGVSLIGNIVPDDERGYYMKNA